jgi:hypothetical protein
MIKGDQQTNSQYNIDSLRAVEISNRISINELTNFCRKTWEGSICLN